MSEQQPGPGWWLASDGRWYPPELAPDAPAEAPQPPPGAQAQPPRVGPPTVSTPVEPRRNWGRVFALGVGLTILGGLAAAAGYVLTDDDAATSTSDTTTTSAPPDTATETTGSSPTTTEPAGERYEDPDTMVSLIVPEGWTLIDLTNRSPDDLAAEISSVLGQDSPKLQAVIGQVDAAVERGEIFYGLNLAAPAAFGTVFLVQPVSEALDPGATGSEAAFRSGLEAANVTDLRIQRIETSLGPALYARYGLPATGLDGQPITLEGRQYVVGAGSSVFLLAMSTDDPQRDAAAFETMADTFTVG